MSIKNIAFRGDVSVQIGLRDFGSINSWIGDKHKQHIDAEVKDGYVLLFPKVDGKRTGRVKKMPMASIAYIDEEYETEKKK